MLMVDTIALTNTYIRPVASSLSTISLVSMDTFAIVQKIKRQTLSALSWMHADMCHHVLAWLVYAIRKEIAPAIPQRCNIISFHLLMHHKYLVIVIIRARVVHCCLSAERHGVFTCSDVRSLSCRLLWKWWHWLNVEYHLLCRSIHHHPLIS